MRLVQSILITLIISCLFSSAFAFLPPSVQYNATVYSDPDQSYCTANYRSDKINPENTISYSGAGEYSGLSSPGVQSCTGCKYDNKSQSCICKTCYSYYNN